MKRVFLFAAGLAVCTWSFSARAADAPPTTPFDAQDKEIQAIKKLDWKSIDWNSLDSRTKCVSLIVMNKLLDMIGGKAAARADLLMSYIEANNLSDAYANDPAVAAEPKGVNFEQGRQIAAAVLKMPEVAEKAAGEMEGMSEDLLAKYITMYEKTCRRNLEEVSESRFHVRAMAGFLERQGKFKEYSAWAAAESKRRQEAYAEQQKAQRTATAAANKEREDRAAAEAEKRKQEAHELAMKRLDYAMQWEKSAIDSGAYNQPVERYVEDDDDGDGWNDNWVWGVHAYYANPGYRAQVRDRVNNWNNRPRVSPRRR